MDIIFLIASQRKTVEFEDIKKENLASLKEIKDNNLILDQNIFLLLNNTDITDKDFLITGIQYLNTYIQQKKEISYCQKELSPAIYLNDQVTQLINNIQLKYLDKLILKILQILNNKINEFNASIDFSQSKYQEMHKLFEITNFINDCFKQRVEIFSKFKNPNLYTGNSTEQKYQQEIDYLSECIKSEQDIKLLIENQDKKKN